MVRCMLLCTYGGCIVRCTYGEMYVIEYVW